ncbi:C39 family peptidase [Fructobacillus sp. W13]|uniref:C39 family peptidase n=1 Tax=Fructobacillus apis TaxID=2935017 RepID=A0ABT0ZNV6_9LACO|nr:C39 family peptidase [Fructobacillus apis]MCO0831673.1 C39 family peptidase [Fructobacillus apis]
MHKKLYKAGKNWVAVAIVAAGFGLVSTTASADENNGITATTTKVADVKPAVQESTGQTTTEEASSQNTQGTSSQAASSQATQESAQAAPEVAPQKSARDQALDNFAAKGVSGYIYSPEVSGANGGYNWFEGGHLFTGFRYYMGTFYWFVDGVRQNAGWREAWGMTYWTDNDGRAVQGHRNINGQDFYFGDDGGFYLRSSGYLHDGSNQNGGYRWYENGKLFTGFRYYMGTFYWFVDGVRQNAGWRQAWGMTYYTDENGRAVQGTRIIDGKLYDFGNDNSYYMRPISGYLYDGSNQNGGYRWYENGQLFTGFRFYMGTYYWFVDGVRQNQGWRQAWGMTYYTDNNGRAVQGRQYIDGAGYFFGHDGSYYMRTNGYVGDNDGIYFVGGDGRFLTGHQNLYGRDVNFFGDGRLDMNGIRIDFGHWSLNQNQLGAPEGCEGVSFQMALSAKGKGVPSVQDIYNRIGYGWGVSPYNGFHGNPFGRGAGETQTVLAGALANRLNGAFGVQTKDITGANANDVIGQLLAYNPVISYIPWDYRVGADGDHFHVQLIYGYRDGGFLIADPLQAGRGANYWMSVGEWSYLNSHLQPVGYGAPASMNVAVI